MLALPCLAMCQQSSWQRRAIGLTASLPWINNFHYYNYDAQKPASKSGFVGVGAAAYYKWGKNKVSLNFGFNGSSPVPLGPYDYSKDSARTSILSTLWEGLYHRNVYKRINVLAGVNCVEYLFDYVGAVNTGIYYSRSDKTIGITVGGEYRFSTNSTLALIYRPALVSFGVKQYMHVVSLDARFDFNIWKNKQQK
jgi:hypothetical protein